MSYRPEDNPLRDVKVKTTKGIDAAHLIHVLLHGDDKDYKQPQATDSMETRQKRERLSNF